MTNKVWTDDMVAMLSDLYPKLGKVACAERMGLTEAQVRQKASRLQIKARGTSEAWSEKNKNHANLLTGRKRPDQSLVMKNLHKEGKLLVPHDVLVERGKRLAEHVKKAGHPRGMLGLKHTQETKNHLSKKSSQMWSSMTEDEKSEMILKGMKTRAKNGTMANERIGTTWKSAWREIGGVKKYYRSRWEANYAYYLEWLKSKGEIKSWSHEPKTFWFDGIKRGCVSYLPDFCVIEKNGEEVYHEVKGWMDDRSKTKIKRMAKYHPDVSLIVVDSKAYASLKKNVSMFVPGWEE